MKKIAILQSNYIPWKGYFDMIAAVDEFIIFDDAQYTKNDWRNRNIIKTSQGSKWLTVPVTLSGNFGQSIRETRISSTNWPRKHWASLAQNYCRASHFKEISTWLQPLYLTNECSLLSPVNRRFIEAICDYLGIRTKISNSWDYSLIEGKNDRLVDLITQAGGNEYISGKAAMEYIDPELFDKNGIKLTWFDYSDYPKYEQLWGPFDHKVTVLDLLFNCGSNSKQYMKYVDRPSPCSKTK